MNDEAESSRAGLHHGTDDTSDIDSSIVNEAAERADRERVEDIVKQRKLIAKKKRVALLDNLLRELDTLIFLELIVIYYLDCSFFWFFIRVIIQVTILTPLPDIALMTQREEQKPFLPLILAFWVICSILHLIYPRPSAGEETRGYLHGGLSIDFIGQKGPISKLHLAFLDACIMVLQLVMLSVHVKRRELKKRLPRSAGGTAEGASIQSTQSTDAGGTATATRNQDADSEERGVLRRTDTLSDAGQEPDEEDELLSSQGPSDSPSSSMTVDAFDTLNSGQATIADLYIIDTLLQEHESYQTSRQTRTSSATTSLSPQTLRQLNSIRVRLGGG